MKKTSAKCNICYTKNKNKVTVIKIRAIRGLCRVYSATYKTRIYTKF